MLIRFCSSIARLTARVAAAVLRPDLLMLLLAAIFVASDAIFAKQ
jgi:hypothetical protein